MRRNCSENTDFREAAADLTERFHCRGYPRKIIGKAFEVARTSTREDLLKPKVRIKDTQLRVITQYNNQWSDLYQVLNQNWHMLTMDPRLSVHVTSKPQLVARRAPNIKDKLVQSHFQNKGMGTSKRTTTGPRMWYMP